MTTLTNTDFYSDQVQITDDVKADVFAPMAKDFSSPFGFYVKQLEDHIAALKQAAVNNPQVNNLRVAWSPTSRRIVLFGTLPWSQEKIAAFENASKDEKNEVEQLRLLIAKHPKKAMDAISFMLETQRAGESSRQG